MPTAGSPPGPFVLGRFRRPGGSEFAGLVAGGYVVPLSDLLPHSGRTGAELSMNDVLADWPAAFATLARQVPELRPAAGPPADLSAVTPVEDLEILTPVTPRQVFQSGANYRTHVIDLMVAQRSDAQPGESDEQIRHRAAAMMDARAANDTPYVFIGLPSALSGPYDDVVLPVTGAEHDWELELAAVIGRPAYQVARQDALDYVAGYTMVNDVTTRDRVFRPDLPAIGTDWLAGKNAPTFLPTGPWLVPAAFAGDPMQLRISLSLNGELMQDESTADMIFDVPRLIEHVSAIATMLPGDLLLTGSPAGNGAHYGRFLRPGDVMEGAITGLGSQRNVCTSGRPSR